MLVRKFRIGGTHMAAGHRISKDDFGSLLIHLKYYF